MIDTFGGVAHLARAFEWHSKGSRFKSDRLQHYDEKLPLNGGSFFVCPLYSLMRARFSSINDNAGMYEHSRQDR